MSVVTVLPEACKYLKTNSQPLRPSLRGMESIYTVTPSSSKFSVLSRRKMNQKNAYRDRNPTLVPAVSEIKQRVLSARMLRIKQLQNQVSEAQHRIAELTSENRLLKSLHKRQDSALSKYENSNAELPQLLHSHSEELRMWQTRCRNLQRQNKELQERLKQKETVLLTITDQNKHLLQLNKDKNLLERATLNDRVKLLEQRLIDKEKELKIFARRYQLEMKVQRTNLLMEQQKYRDLMNKLEISDTMLMLPSKTSKHKTLVNKTTLNRLNSRSAANPSRVGGSDKELSDDTSPTRSNVLPAFKNDSIVKKKNDDKTKRISSPNGNVNGINDKNNSCISDLDGANDDDGYDLNEIDLTKNNCVDKSNECENHGTTCHDEDTNRLKNGMHRARQQQKKTTVKTDPKLSPSHDESKIKSNKNVDCKGDKKSLSNDSELSDDDFRYTFSSHDGTKTAPIINARDLLDHKMHINELEEKMKQNSLDEKSNPHQYLPKSANSSNLSSNDDDMTIRNDDAISHYSFNHHHHHLTATTTHNQFNDRGDSELITMQQELRESHINRESILDEYCETIYDDDKASHYSDNSYAPRVRRVGYAREVAPNNSTNINIGGGGATNGGNFSKIKSPYQADNYAKSNGHARNGRRQSINGVGKPTKLDEGKKSQLLAILKTMDGNGNEDN